MNALDPNLTALLTKVTLILAVALMAHLGLRRASAATRHLSLTLAMISLVVMPFLSLGLPVWQLEVLPQSTTAAPSAVATPRAEMELGGSAGGWLQVAGM